MELSKKQAEFWTALIVLCIITAIAVLLVDFGIKAAILEESNALRLEIEKHGQSAGKSAQNGADNNAPDHSPIPGDVLGNVPTRLETGNVHNGVSKEVPKGQETIGKSNGRRPRANPSRAAGNRELPSRDKQVG